MVRVVGKSLITLNQYLDEQTARKVDRASPRISNVLVDGRITTGNQQLTNVDPAGTQIYMGNPATQLHLESNATVQVNVDGDVKPLYRRGDGGLAQSEVSGLGDALTGKAAYWHNHQQNEIIDLQRDMGRRWELTGGVDIPFNADVNSLEYWQPGNFKIPTHEIAHTISNLPVQEAGTIKAFATTGTAIGLTGAWAYMGQMYQTLSQHVYYRFANTNGEGTPYYDVWKKIYQEGDGLIKQVGYVMFTIPSTGWLYDGTYDRYYQVFDISPTPVYCNINIVSVTGANFPIIGAEVFETTKLRVFMADVPTVSALTTFRFSLAQ